MFLDILSQFWAKNFKKRLFTCYNIGFSRNFSPMSRSPLGPPDTAKIRSYTNSTPQETYTSMFLASYLPYFSKYHVFQKWFLFFMHSIVVHEKKTTFFSGFPLSQRFEIWYAYIWTKCKPTCAGGTPGNPWKPYYFKLKK